MIYQPNFDGLRHLEQRFESHRHIIFFQAVETQTWNFHVLLETNAYQSMTRAMEFLSAKMEVMKKIVQVFKTNSLIKIICIKNYHC